MKKKFIFAYILLVAASLFACIKNGGEIISKKGQYPGNNMPANVPELFAPGIVTNGYQTRDVAITPDGNEIYFGARSAGYYTILVTRKNKDGWSRPEVVEHLKDPSYMNIEPALNSDGSKLFFLSNRPDSTRGTSYGEEDIWVMDREGDHWGEPYNLGEPVNSLQREFYPSLTDDGTLYFTRNDKDSPIANIYRSKLIDGKYQEPEKLPVQVNSGQNHFNAFISHDESYIIVPTIGRKDSYGGTDYYIVFRNKDDKWSNPINMGDMINTPDGVEYSAYVTRDGKVLFFMSRRLAEKPDSLSFDFMLKQHNKPENGNPSIYWMNAGIIDSLRQQAVFTSNPE